MKQTYIDVEANDDGESSDEAFEQATNLHANGYARDNFVVDDDDDEQYEDDAEEQFEEQFPKVPRRGPPPTRSRAVGPPISGDPLLDGLDPDRLHFVNEFLEGARELGANIMKRRNLKDRPFTDTILMEMAIKNVKSKDQMLRIARVRPEMVDAYGDQYLDNLTSLRAVFAGEGKVIEAKPFDPNREVVIDLRSDDDEPAEDELDDTEDETEDEDDGPSGYFAQTSSFNGPPAAGGGASEAARAWNAQWASFSGAANRAPSAAPAARKSKYSPKRKYSGGGSKKASGSQKVAYFAKKNAIANNKKGVAKKRKSSDGPARSRNAGGGLSRSGGGGGLGGRGGIGLMPT